ncbi:6-phosphofructokinase [Haloactinopolyspora alba]|nr:6-phosphofructokinase [Haloactinopolyspora alba]
MRVVLGQTGAPTTVVNRSVAGFLDGASGHEVLLARGGPDALVAGAFDAPARMPGDAERAGGSWLGGGRRATTPEDVDRIVTALAGQRVDGLCLIGGNGTMALLDAVSERARARGVALRVVGIPKTIDNDLDGVDHAPGFASAARFLSAVLPDIARDHRAMRSVEPVRIVETMGRSTGWLALAATLPADPDHPVHRVYIPELAFDRDDFVADVDRLVGRHGRALVVVSEGVAPELTAQPIHDTNHTRLLAGGVARELAGVVAAELGLPARGEVIGVVQRCASHLVSTADAHEARAVGGAAARLLTDADAPAHTAVMVGLERRDAGPDRPYQVTHPAVPLGDVAGRTRAVPERWRTPDPRELNSFHAWLSPLVHEPHVTAATPVTTALEAL